MHLEYDGGSLYVPVYRIGAVHRYMRRRGGRHQARQAGRATWQEKRRRVSAEAQKIAEELMQLYAQRAALAGHAFPPPDAMFRAFEATFPFEETPDQAKAIDAVLGDMQAGVPMDRLVCGDVGYGKTEVALRASLLAVLGGKQVAVLAPTTVLAEQHFVTFSERFADFPVRVAVLSRFRSKAEQTQHGRGAGGGQDRRRRRHAPAAVARRALQGPRPAGHRRGAALRRRRTRSGSRSCARRSTC